MHDSTWKTIRLLVGRSLTHPYILKYISKYQSLFKDVHAEVCLWVYMTEWCALYRKSTTQYNHSKVQYYREAMYAMCSDTFNHSQEHYGIYMINRLLVLRNWPETNLGTRISFYSSFVSEFRLRSSWSHSVFFFAVVVGGNLPACI